MDIGTNQQKSSETIGEFCLAERISKAAYYELKKRGLGPDEFEIPGTRIKRITPEAHRAWRERMVELAKSEAAQLEAERQRKLATVAGRIAAASPLHVSKRIEWENCPRELEKAEVGPRPIVTDSRASVS